jgi:hypothetical protein
VGGLSLLESAERLGRCAWAEEQAFEILGHWSVDEALPGARVLFAAHSAHHGWRAELVRDRLPQLADRSPSDFVDPGNATMATALDEVRGQPATRDRLVAAYRVLLPGLAAAYTRHAGVLSLPGDASTARLLRILVTDVEEDLSEGEQLLRLHLSTSLQMAEAETVRRRLVGAWMSPPGIT